MLSELNDKKFHNVHLWKRGVDTNQFHPNRYDDQMREMLTGRNKDKRLLLYVGRLAPEKEIERIRSVLQQSSEFCLAIVGDGPHRAFLEDYFKGTDTVFTGFLYGDDLASAYASSDIFVFPSTTETLGLVLLEGMASGLPIVAAKSGPTSEQITDGLNGLLYEPDQPNDFVNCIMKLKDEKYRMALAGKAFAASQSIGWEEPSKQLFEFYQEAMKTFKRA